jgi:serine protease
VFDMTRHVFAIALLLPATAMLVLARQPPAQGGAAKQRLNGAAIPAVLLPLRTEPVNLPVEPSVGPGAIPDGWDLDPATGAYYRRGELLVRFREGANQNLRALALQRSGARRMPDVLPSNWERVTVDSVGRTAEAIATLRQSGAADEVTLNYRMTAQQVRPNDEDYRLQWNFDAIDMPDAWQINPGSRNDVVVAVVDTGMNTVNDTFVFSNSFIGQVAIPFSQVPDLFAQGRIVAPYDFVYRDSMPLDLHGHGTHVAGTIGQLTNNNIGVAGIAYNVKLMPVKVLGDGWDAVLAPGNNGGSTSLVAEGIRYAADNGAKVINLSLGGTGPSPIERDAIQYAVGKGAFVAIAAGNEAEDGNPTVYPAAYGSDIAGAMTVGAVSRSLKRASYSGFKPYVEICAPGGDVVGGVVDFDSGVTQVTYDLASSLSFLSPLDMLRVLNVGFRPRFDRFALEPFVGTSMATPHISGVAALLYSQGIHNPAAIEQAIKRFARSISATTDECGAGLVDPRRVLRGLGLSR